MLNWNTVLTYVKGRLALPSSFIEKTDTELKEWIKITTIPEFSLYYPDVETVSVLPTNPDTVVPGSSNKYYFYDEEDLDIIGIKQCYFSLSNDIVSGHPIFGAMSFEGMKNWSLEVFKSKFFMPFSNWHKTYKFIGPNIIHVLPDAQNENFVVEYEREQPHDLRKIPASLKRHFMDLALADVMIQLGSIRTGYQGMTTPFGDLPIRGDELKTEGQDLRREIIDQIREDTFPPMIIEIE
ncbi:MAG: hypothetical protein KAS32_14230 [Candidatus Peribacteraceae bacterium]|nr:hypothetical protein [Candidatus Peribacteraceae bacterium]